MSVTYLKIIPADIRLVPRETAHGEIVRLVEEAFPAAEEIELHAYGHPVFVDQGQNLNAILCPACEVRLEFANQEVDPLRDWWYEMSDPLGETSVAHVLLEMPCCRAVVPFAALQFDWPAGVASFEIAVMDPGVAETPSLEWRRRVEALIGGPIRFIWAAY
jgi:hypothetical protein